MRAQHHLFGAALAVMSFAACDLPTEAPIIEQRWVLPVEETFIGVADLLPANVAEQGSAFRVTLDPATTTTALGEACAACLTLNGQTAPKPSFSTNLVLNQALPARVMGVELQNTEIPIVIDNGFGFDPLRPGGANGSLSITVRNGAGGAVLGSLALSGASVSVPAGSSLTRSIALNGTATTAFRVEVALSSPQGSATRIDTSQIFTVRTILTTINVSSVSATVVGEGLAIDAVSLDTEDLDQTVVERIVEGGIRLEVVNPFGVAATGQITIDYTDGRVAKDLSISAGSSTQTVSFTGAELQSFLGVDGATLTGALTVSDNPAVATLTPGQTITIRSLIDVTLRIGG